MDRESLFLRTDVSEKHVSLIFRVKEGQHEEKHTGGNMFLRNVGLIFNGLCGDISQKMAELVTKA
jgi:hypothetical protein